MKLQTPVAETPCRCEISYGDKILLLGSCFSDNIGRTLIDYGFDALVNPFGTLYNPASIRSAVERLVSGREFTREDCVPMGSGAGKICSFSHHTSFARDSEDEFLENANSALRSAATFFRTCNKVIITLGTAWCYRYVGSTGEGSARKGEGVPRTADDESGVANIAPSNEGKIVSNCLKRDQKEFVRERLSLAECVENLTYIIGVCSGKDIIFTVSPIRHLADGAHENQLSKSTLLLAINEVDCDYFPAYEIMMDELRDYRFYAEDMVHPSAQAIAHIAERFLARHLSPAEKTLLEERIRLHKQSLHRPNM